MAAYGIISPAQARSAIAPGAFDIKGSFRDFNQVLNGLMKDYSDPTKDLVTSNGVVIKASQKYTPLGQLFFNNEVSQLEQRQETLLASWQALYQFEKSITGTG